MPKSKAELAAQRAAHYQANKEKNKADAKVYYQANSEKIKANIKAYQQTPKGKKSQRISTWKQRGIISDDFDALYEQFLGTINCEDCQCILTVDKQNTSTTRMMDHCHQTGLPRGVVCHACNLKRG